jgi:hypothetical protein
MPDYTQDIAFGMQNASVLRSNFARASQSMMDQRRRESASQFLAQTDDYFLDPHVKSAALHGMSSGMLDPGFVFQLARLKQAREADRIADQKWQFDRFLAMQSADLKERQFALSEAQEERLQAKLSFDREKYGDERMDLVYDRIRQENLDLEKRLKTQWDIDIREREYQNELDRLEIDRNKDLLAREAFREQRMENELQRVMKFLDPQQERLAMSRVAQMYSSYGGLPEGADFGFTNFMQAALDAQRRAQQGEGGGEAPAQAEQQLPSNRPIIDMLMRRSIWKMMVRERIMTGKIPPGALMSIGRLDEGDIVGALSVFSANKQQAFWDNLRRTDAEQAMGYLTPTREGDRLTLAGEEFMKDQILEHIAPGTSEGAWLFSDAARRFEHDTMESYRTAREAEEREGRRPSIMSDVVRNFEDLEALIVPGTEPEQGPGLPPMQGAEPPPGVPQPQRQMGPELPPIHGPQGPGSDIYGPILDEPSFEDMGPAHWFIDPKNPYGVAGRGR